MKQQPIYCNHSVCHLCSRRENTKMKIRTMSPSSRILMLTMTSLYLAQVVSAETLCGGELVDALQFVCGTRGFYFSRPNSRSTSRRTQKGIVEECCFRSCDLYLLEQYCAKPTKSERAVSDASVLVIPVLLPANKKPPTSMYSKYEIWERKAAQRLRRGIPAILRAKKFRKQAVEAQARDQEVFHRTLIPLRSKLPPGPSRTDQRAVHK